MPGAPNAGVPLVADPGVGVVAGGPIGLGWLVRVTGYHYHNHNHPAEIAPENVEYYQGAQYVHETLIKSLAGLGEKLIFPAKDETGQAEAVSVTDLGIGFPVLVDPGQIYPDKLINPNVEGASALAMAGGAGSYSEDYYDDEAMGYRPGMTRRPGTTGTSEEDEEAEDPVIDVLKFDFTVEFCWQPEMPGAPEEQDQPLSPETQPAEQESEAQP